MSVHAERVHAPWLGVLLFIASEVMLFGALFASYFTLAERAGTWPPEGTHEAELVVPLLLTAVLMASSVTQHLAAGHARGGRRAQARRMMAATALLGLLFAVGQAYEYVTAPFSVGDNAFTTAFYTITGFHGLHVLGGVAGVLVARAAVTDLGIVEGATAYWHFVDVVWLVVLTVLYVVR